MSARTTARGLRSTLQEGWAAWPSFVGCLLFVSCFGFVEEREPLFFVGSIRAWGVLVDQVPHDLFHGEAACREVQRGETLHGCGPRVLFRLRIYVQVTSRVPAPRVERLHLVLVPENPVRVLWRGRRILVAVSEGRHLPQVPLGSLAIEYPHHVLELQKTAVFEFDGGYGWEPVNVRRVVSNGPVAVSPVGYLLDRELDLLDADGFVQDYTEVIGEPLDG